MDELRAFFNPGPSGNKVKKLRGPLTSGFRYTKEDASNLLNRKEEHRHSVMQGGTDYALGLKERETEMFIQSENTRNFKNSISGGLESMEKLSLCDINKLSEEAALLPFEKNAYRIKEDNNNLGINGYKQQILDCINNYSVVIVEGPTGCGKTTQVPQWILDDAFKNKKPCRIIVTQPRRIAAISIAKRVAQERGWDIGGLVGYQVALENKTSTETMIRYVTTGVLLQKLVSAKNMNEYTHIILDEVHERGQEMDFLLIVVKRLLYTVSPNVKVVLMSATFNTKVFFDYFNVFSHKNTATCIEVAKKEKMFPIKTFYLNQINKLLVSFSLANKEKPSIEPEEYHLVVKLVHAFEKIDKTEEVFDDDTEASYPSVLIFLPGINEIEQMYSCLTDDTLRRNMDCQSQTHKWWVLPLHSTITADEQVRVFQRPPPSHRKIILATNIAESSITVPDIKYVVDFCLMKQLVADKNTNFTSLEMTWASRANCEQRAGRAGRVRDGRVYRLVSQKAYDNLEPECWPEILRCPLERLVLLSKTLDMGPPSDILALAINPPDLHNIHRTVLVLKEMGALTKLQDDQWVAHDGDLTFMGRIMAKLPIDVRLSKLIVLGNIFGCLEECIIMAASMSVKNIFSNPFRERLNAYNSKLTWADGCTSDCITFLNVYKVWNLLRQRQEFKQQGNSEMQWARRFYVQTRALRELNDMVRELTMRLSRENIEIINGPSPWTKEQLLLALKVLLAGAFYPQYFVQVSRDEDREKDAIRTLGGLDPRNTVYLKNFPDDQPGKIYAGAIKNIIKQKIGDEPRVTFDRNSRKVYLTFEDNRFNSNREAESGRTLTSRVRQNANPFIPGQVVLPVYKSVKARQLKIDVRIPLLPPDKAQAMAEVVDADATFEEMEKMVPKLPQVEDTYFAIRICNRQSVFKFWARDKVYDQLVNEIQTALNSGPLPGAAAAAPGSLAAAPCPQLHAAVCRARLLRVLPGDTVEVLYIDWGFTGRVKACNVRALPAPWAATPPLCMPCSLARVQPAPAAARPGAATAAHPNILDRADTAKVYSVVHGVVNVELLVDNGRINVNNELVKLGYAVHCEESYDSKLNHDLREMACELSLTQQRGYNREMIEQAYHQLRDIEPPNFKDCVSDAFLNGPFSPLETSVHSLMYSSREKQVTIEWNSVNSVLLDTDPQEVYERLLVAGEIGQNEINSKLSLRHTTLMPNIPGLPAIVGLLFCPNAELRRSSSGARYVSALCGAGSSASGAPYFPEHDLLLHIDADLSVDHLALINHIRYLMDCMMNNVDKDVEEAKKVSKRIRDNLLALLTAKRKHYEPESVPREWEWKSVPEDELLEMTAPDMDNAAGIYPMHTPQELYPLSQEQLLALKRENDQLKLMVNRNWSSADLVCKLCNTTPMSVQAMRLHLYSNSHQEKEEDFNIFRS